MSILVLEDIHRAFGDRAALRGVSVTAQAGEVIGLIGKNGAGKSTLLRIALGLLHADRGSVRVFGMDPWDHPVEVKRRVGFVPEYEGTFSRAKIQELLQLHAALYPTWDDELALRLLGSLAKDTSVRLDRLSGGQARRVVLTCAMAHRPELLLLDEPAGGLDPSARRECLELAIELLNEAGTTIVFSSHYMGDVSRIASRVVLLDRGVTLLDKELDELKEKYCLALLPNAGATELAALQQLPGFVRHRSRGSATQAVFALESAQAQRVLSQQLGLSDVRCTAVNLEELFINLVGSEA